ncbi:SIMPL domain-containing protein, partial [Microcoleus sp. B3-D7]|uniref:SIMPL domain-containing protein n=1 Tax=Microcoleus sp. B3-D7 TaxID=2818659 RepID=UPI002FD46D89
SARKQALRKATQDAQAQADAVFSALNLKRGEILGIQVNGAIALIPDRNPHKSIAITADKHEIRTLENLALMQALLDNHSECFLSLTQ